VGRLKNLMLIKDDATVACGKWRTLISSTVDVIQLWHCVLMYLVLVLDQTGNCCNTVLFLSVEFQQPTVTHEYLNRRKLNSDDNNKF